MRVSFSVLSNPRVLALVEQAILSGTNFLVFLYCARILDREEWGVFAFGYSAVIFVQGFQRALVIIPMITFSGGHNAWANSARFWSRRNCFFTIMTCLSLLLIAGMLWLTGVKWVAMSLLLAALMTVATFFQEFWRRAVILDGRFYVLVGMAIFYGLGCAITLGVWSVNMRGFWMEAGSFLNLHVPPSWVPVNMHGFWMEAGSFLNLHVLPSWVTVNMRGSWIVAGSVIVGASLATIIYFLFRKSRHSNTDVQAVAPAGYLSFSRWAVLSHIGFSGYNFGIQSLLGAMGGPAAVGVFQATRTLMQPVNTFIGAMDSIDKPRAASRYSKSGRRGLFGALRRALLALLGLSVPYVVIASGYADWLLELAYAGRYTEQTHVVWMWGVVALAMVFAQPIESGLYVIRRTREMFFSRLGAAVLSIICAPWLIITWGVSGALMAVLLGFIVTAVAGITILKRYA